MTSYLDHGPDLGQRWLQSMLRIRAFETVLAAAHSRGDLVGGVHLAIGQEAVAAAFGELLEPGDQITTSHRGHHHMIARGLDPVRVYGEIQGRANGYCGGKGGSMHVSSLEDGVAGANGVVAGGVPMTLGLAIAAKHRDESRIAVSFIGDGAMNQGVVFEVLNLAALWLCPLVIVCENNGWGQFSSADSVTAGPGLHTRALGFGLPGEQVDGNDPEAVHTAAEVAIERARTGLGPTLVECMTDRWRGHHEGEERYAGEYRQTAEWRDPIVLLRERMSALGGTAEAQWDEWAAAADHEMESAFAEAQDAPLPDPGEARKGVFANVSG